MVAELLDIEKEVILLRAIKELIDSMVNFEILKIVGNDPNSEIRFVSITHKRFFNVVLVDFLSRTDKKAPINQTSYLGGLKAITSNPNFNLNNSVKQLSETTTLFSNWLEQEIIVEKVWLPAIDIEAKIKITRINFIKMCGNISKHNFLRSVGVAEELQATLAATDIKITIDDALLALSDFYEWFHDDIFSYHSSTIAEFLNNIRWGIYEYLQPEFQKSIVRDAQSSVRYHYTYPREVTNRFAKSCYWDLMNEVRDPPYVRRFEVTKWLKLQY